MLPDFFKPTKSLRSNLVRIGPKRDGGYVIDKKVTKKTKKIITCSLNDDWAFEKNFIQNNKECAIQAYVHTVNNKFWIKNAKSNVKYPIECLEFKNHRSKEEINLRFHD